MRQLVRYLTRAMYVYGVKPILFRYRPDGVHHGMVKITKIVQRVPVACALPRLWAARNEKILSQTIAGVEFRNPIGLSAGFDKEISMPRMIKNVGFGWMTGGSVTWGQYKGNDGAWFYRLPKTKSLVVHAGLPSEGTEVVSARVAAYDAKLFAEFPLSVSVAKTNTKATVSEAKAVEDYCASLAAFARLDTVALLEINISCPNTFGGEPFTTPQRLGKLLTATDKLAITKPMFVKMPINLPLAEFEKLLDVIAKHTIAGVTIGNLHKDRRAVDVQDVLPEHVKGNLSGAPTKVITTELIRHTYKKYGDRLTIIGVGGVFSAQDAYEKIQAGASLVGLITGMIFEGPQLAGQINHDLVRLLKKDGYSHITQAVGSKKCYTRSTRS